MSEPLPDVLITNIYIFWKRCILQLRHEPEKLIKRAKKEMGKDECATIYNGNGLGIYHPVSPVASATDPYLQMQWAVFELATRGASAFRPWSATASRKHRDR